MNIQGYSSRWRVYPSFQGPKIQKFLLCGHRIDHYIAYFSLVHFKCNIFHLLTKLNIISSECQKLVSYLAYHITFFYCSIHCSVYFFLCKWLLIAVNISFVKFCLLRHILIITLELVSYIFQLWWCKYLISVICL